MIWSIFLSDSQTSADRTAPPSDVSSRRYEPMFDALDIGFCVIEVKFDAEELPLDYRFIETNDAFERHTGLVGAAGRWMRQLRPDHEQHWFDIYGQVALTGEAIRFENEAAALGRWYDVHAYQVDDPALHHVALIFNDISARKSAELKVQALNDLLEAEVAARTEEKDRLWSLSLDPFLIADSKGIWLSVSPAWTEILGWTEAELIGRTSAWMEHPDDQVKTRAEVVSLADGAEAQRFENRFRTKAGDYRVFSWTAVERDELLYCVARDVTAERAHAQELKDAQDFSRLALAAVGGVGVWTYDVQADRFHFDAAIAELYGLDVADGEVGLSRLDFLAHVHPDDVPGLRKTMDGGLISSGDLELEYRLVGPGGRVRWVLSRGHTYFDDAGAPIRRTGVGVEVTRQREIENQLRQSQKMEAVGQLTGGLAHDFNNLLQGISGSLELLQGRVSQGRFDTIDRYVAAAQGASRRAAALTQRLLAFSRRQTLDTKLTNVNGLLSNLEDLLRRTVGASVEIELVGAGGVWPVLIDGNQLENAILNLCINARDAMPGGGRITIETANKWLDEAAGRQHDLPAGQYVSICVTDTGTGMKPETIARIFDPFFTTKPLGEGTGLGLSMVYGFARQSGGQVRVYSEPGQGTTMCLYFPRHFGSAEIERTTLPPEPARAAGEGRTVLVVDDEPTVRMMIAEVMDEAGFRTIEASDGASALAILQSNARIDLLITDVGLPGGLNGRQVFDAAKVMRPDLKTLFVTGFADNAAVGNGHVERGVALLTKPFTIGALQAKVHDLSAEG